MKLDKELIDKVELAVKKYIKAYPAEFAAYKKYMSSYRANLRTPWAEVNGYDNVMIRELIRWPSELYNLIKAVLTPIEQLEFAQDKYQIWFGNKFADFRATEGKL